MLQTPNYRPPGRVLALGKPQEEGEGAGWDEDVMPTLRKRLEAESSVLQRRLSQTQKIPASASASTSRIPLPTSSIPRPFPSGSGLSASVNLTPTRSGVWTDRQTANTTKAAGTKSQLVPPKSHFPTSRSSLLGASGSGLTSPRQGRNEGTPNFVSLRARVKSTPTALGGSTGAGSSSVPGPVTGTGREPSGSGRTSGVAGISSEISKQAPIEDQKGGGAGRDLTPKVESTGQRSGLPKMGETSLGRTIPRNTSGSSPPIPSNLSIPTGIPTQTSTSPSSIPTSPFASRLPIPQARSPPRLSPPLDAGSPSGSPSGGSSPRSRTPHAGSPVDGRRPSAQSSSSIPGMSPDDVRRPSGQAGLSTPRISPDPSGARRQRSPSPKVMASSRGDTPMNAVPIVLSDIGCGDSFEATMTGEDPFPMETDGLRVLGPDEGDNSERGSVNFPLPEPDLGDAGSRSSMMLDIKDEVPPFLMDPGDLMADEGHHKDVARGTTIHRPAQEKAPLAKGDIGTEGTQTSGDIDGQTDRERRVAEAMSIAAHGHDLTRGTRYQDQSDVTGAIPVPIRRDQSGTSSGARERQRTGSLAALDSKRRDQSDRPRADFLAPYQSASPKGRIDHLNRAQSPPRSTSANEFGRYLQEGQSQPPAGVPGSSSAFSLASRIKASPKHYPPAAYAIPIINKSDNIDVIPTVAKRLALEQSQRLGISPEDQLVPAGDDELITEWAPDGTPLKRVKVEPKRFQQTLQVGSGMKSRQGSFGVALSQAEESGETNPPTAPGMFNYDASKAYDPNKPRPGPPADMRIPQHIRTESSQSTHRFPIAPGPSSPSPFSNFGPSATEAERKPSLLEDSPAWGSMARKGSETGSAILRKPSLRFRTHSATASQASLRGQQPRNAKGVIKLDNIQVKAQDTRPWASFDLPPNTQAGTGPPKLTGNQTASEPLARKAGKRKEDDSHGGGCKCIIM